MSALLGLFVVGLFAPAFLPLNHSSEWMIVDLAAIGAALAGAFLGFLFALPHPNPLAQNANALLLPSTNLQDVATKLTQFVSGATLASLAVLPHYIGKFGGLVANAVHAPWGQIVGDSVLVSYTSLGFLIAYILTTTVGSVEFLKVDQKLLNQGAEELKETLPDAGSDATDEQRCLAQKIAKLPLSAMKDATEQLTWARAQTIVEDFPEARKAYALLYANDQSDPAILVEYATALYDDSSFSDYQYILQMVDAASKCADANDPSLQPRIAALRAATNLYIDGQYVTAIDAVNDFLRNHADLTPAKTMRFYRACGFGQMYRASKVTFEDADLKAVSNRILSDSAVTLGFGSRYRQQLLMVSDPAERTDSDPQDDDLQQFAVDSDAFRALLDMKAAPPTPTTSPPPVVPLPAGVTPALYAQQCPP